jgi:hypothetical protein
MKLINQLVFMTDKMITCWKMENVGIKHGHITWPKHISTIRTLLAEGSIQCIVQRLNHFSIKNETMSTTAFIVVCYMICSYFYSHCRVSNNEHTYFILLPNDFRIVCGQCIFRYTDVWGWSLWPYCTTFFKLQPISPSASVSDVRLSCYRRHKSCDFCFVWLWVCTSHGSFTAN